MVHGDRRGGETNHVSQEEVTGGGRAGDGATPNARFGIDQIGGYCMKRFRTLVVLSASAMLIGTVAVAFAAGPAELDLASATFQLSPTSSPVTVACNPEDALDNGWGMAKITGTWKGPITDTSPNPQPWNTAPTPPDATPDHSVGGLASVKGFVIGDSISGQIVSGWGKLSLTVVQSPLSRYTGSAQIVTQADPANNLIEGRGQLLAKYFTRATKHDPFAFSGDYLVANLEFTINGSNFVVSGQFGGTPGSHAKLDYSAETTELC
jgi:hypothetical protein